MEGRHRALIEWNRSAIKVRNFRSYVWNVVAARRQFGIDSFFVAYRLNNRTDSYDSFRIYILKASKFQTIDSLCHSRCCHSCPTLRFFSTRSMVSRASRLAALFAELNYEYKNSFCLLESFELVFSNLITVSRKKNGNGTSVNSFC